MIFKPLLAVTPWGCVVVLQVQNYEKSLASLKTDFQRAKEKEDKEALMGGGAGVRA